MTISVHGLVNEAEHHLEEFGDHVAVNDYNPDNRDVPTITVLFPKPKKDYRGLGTKTSAKLASISRGLRKPYMEDEDVATFDFEKGFENVLYYENIPYEIDTRQKTWSITKTTRDDPGRNETLFEHPLKGKGKSEKTYFDVLENLEAQRPHVFKPKPVMHRNQALLDISGNKPYLKKLQPRQTVLHEPVVDGNYEGQTAKYYVVPRIGKILRQINDLIYVMKNHPVILLAEVKPWSLRAPKDMDDRYSQLRRYDSILNDAGFEDHPMCLMIPTLPTLTELDNMERFKKKTGRPTYVITVGESNCVIKNIYDEMRKCAKVALNAKKSGLKKATKIFEDQHEKFSKEADYFERMSDDIPMLFP